MQQAVTVVKALLSHITKRAASLLPNLKGPIIYEAGREWKRDFVDWRTNPTMVYILLLLYRAKTIQTLPIEKMKALLSMLEVVPSQQRSP